MTRTIRTYKEHEPETELDAIKLNFKLRDNAAHVARKERVNGPGMSELLKQTAIATNEMIAHLFHPGQHFKRLDINSIPDL